MTVDGSFDEVVRNVFFRIIPTLERVTIRWQFDIRREIGVSKEGTCIISGKEVEFVLSTEDGYVVGEVVEENEGSEVNKIM